MSGQAIDTGQALSWENQKEFHHFFPRNYLRNQGVPNQRISCLANFVMLTSASNKRISNRAPSDYLAEVEEAAGSNLDTWLGANLISRDAFEAAKNDDFAKFLALRSETLHSAVLPLAGWDSSDATEPAVSVDADSAEREEGVGDDSDFTDEPPSRDAVAPG